MHIAESFLEGSRVDLLLSLMQQGETPGLLPVFSCLLCLGCYSKKLGDYLEIMNAYRCALPYASMSVCVFVVVLVRAALLFRFLCVTAWMLLALPMRIFIMHL